MKKFYLVFLALIAILCLAACNKDEKPANEKPVIDAPAEITLSVGERFKLSSHVVSVTDKEDGDLMESLDADLSSLDTSKAGDYTITLVVRDSKGAETTKQMVIHVVAKDEKAPAFTGIGETNIVVGRAFDPRDGVKAIDTKDGEVTFTVEGLVDVDHLGSYTLTYSASDAAGNSETKTRKVNVVTGPFLFKAEDIMSTESVTFTHSAESTVDYDLVKVDFTCEAGATVVVTLGSKSISTVVTGAEGSAYFAFESAPEAALALSVQGGVLVGWTLGDAADSEAPVISGDFTNAVAISKVTKGAALQYVIDMCGVKVQDNRDGYITSGIVLDVEGINWDSKEEQSAYIKVSDLAGNEATKEVKVIVNAETMLADFYADLESFNDNGGFDSASYANLYRGGSLEKVADGDDKDSFKMELDKGGGYWSSSMIRYDLTELVTEGNYYVLKITARAGLEESEGQLTQGISFRLGAQLADSPWYYEFVGCSVGGSDHGENRMNLTSEYQTFYRIFKAEQRVTGTLEPFAVGMEFHQGSQDYNTLYPVYVKEFTLSLLSNEDQAPQVFIDGSKSTVVVSGDNIDLASYAYAIDVEDGNLEIQVEGSLGTEIGEYDITFKATDSKGHTALKTVTFEVLSETDNDAPVITLAGPNPLEVKVNAMTNEEAMLYLFSNLSITDKKNGQVGNVPLTADMISGSVDLTKAGKYKLIVSCKDSSGNEGKLEIIVKVQAEEQSKEEVVADWSGTFGSQENITAEVNEGVVEILPTTFEGGYWASFNKSKIELPQGFAFEIGKTYKLTLVAKADAARTIKISFASASTETPTQYGSIGFVQAELGTDYETFTAEFTYTGQFEKGGNQYTAGYTALEIQVGWDSAFSGAQTTSNKVYIKNLRLSEVVEETTKYETVIDWNGQIGTQENITAEVNEGVVEILPTTFEGGYWASFNKSKFELPQGFSFEVGKTYQIVLTAKADAARTIKASFASASTETPTQYGSIGFIQAELGTDYETFVVEFTYTGQFEKGGNQYTAGYTALELQVGWDSAFSGAQTTTNKVYVKELQLKEKVEAPKFETVIDWNGQIGTQENITAEVNEGVVEILPTTFEGGYWASFNKSKFELPQGFSFEVGKTYQIVLTAKADTARTIKVSFASASTESPTQYGSIGFIQAELGTDYETFTVEFTYTGQFEKGGNQYTAGYTALEVQVGWDSAFTGEQTTTNKVYIKELQVKEKVEEKEEQPKYENLNLLDGTSGTAYCDGSFTTFNPTANGVECTTQKEKWFGIKNFTVPAGSKYFVLVVASNQEGTSLRYKLDNSSNAYDNKKTTVTLEGDTQILIDLEEYGIPVNEICKVVLWDTTNANSVITIKQAYFTDTNPVSE